MAKVLAEILAAALLAVLDACGIAVSAAQRSQISGCADSDQLDAWIRRAATETDVRSLLAC
jgi:hypothetical protein